VVSPSEETARLSASAVWYAKHGWKIHPCHGIVDDRCTCGRPHPEPKERGKHPRLGSWNTQASSDPAVIEKWWQEEVDGNVGVVCNTSGFLVIDIDPRSDGINSFEKFEELLEFELPKTVEALTGEYTYGGKVQRGRHLFFKCDSNEKFVGNLKASGLKGIDIKHDGYVLIAPSRHFSGICYEWAAGHAPWEIEMAEAPEALLNAIRKRNNSRSKSGTAIGEGDWSNIFGGIDFGAEKVDIEKMLSEGIEEGSRAIDIYKLTCAVANKFPVDSEMGRMAVETMMIRYNAEKVKPPLHIEGQGGLLHHVRRAINFVIDNPKKSFISEEVAEWQKGQAARLSSGGSTPSPTVTNSFSAYVQPTSQDTNGDAYLPGTYGGTVNQFMEDGDTVHAAGSGGNIDIPKDPDALSESDGAQVGKRTLSDTGNGRRLIDTFGKGIRYTPGLGWFNWAGNYWKNDAESLEMLELAKRLAPIIASEVVQYSDSDKQNEVVKWASQCKSNSRLKSAIENANSDPRVLVSVDTWDSAEHLLGVQNGVVDLKTGELLKGRPDLHITRRAPVAYTQGLRNVRWEQFLEFATGGDKEFQDWLQRAAGYTMTGMRKYDVMFLVYGPAGSGKNTLIESIVKCLGTKEYAWAMDSSILAAGDGQANGSDLYHWAEIRGRRMVWVDELPDSERLKENSVKKLTGSSEIPARSPGEKPFTFQSQAKLWITTNHRPIINDDAMWRRIRAIPMLNVPERPDPDLKEYLMDPEGGLPAVLAWAVEGAVKMYGSGERDALGTCKVVLDASEIYRKNEDRMGLFLTEETVQSEGATVLIKHLYSQYRFWAEDRGERPMTMTAFQKKLTERSISIEGAGSRAVVVGYSSMPKVVTTTAGQPNYAELGRGITAAKY
jgi:putative DNA primase/helicase